MYDKNLLLDAIWDNPGRVTGLHFDRRGRCWQTSQRPDGTQSHRADKLVLRRVASGQIFANYNGDTYASGDIWTLLAQIHSETFEELLLRAAMAYGIKDDDPKTQERVKELQRRQTMYGFAQVCKGVLLSVPLADTDRDICDSYTASRGLSKSADLLPFGRSAKLLCVKAMRNAYKTMPEADIVAAVNELYPTIRTDYRSGTPTAMDFADYYRLAIPYINGNRALGFCLRQTAPASYIDKDGKTCTMPKYIYSKDMPKSGWCGQLDGKTPVYMVEGILDAIALRQAGIRNVLALGGMTPTDNEDEAKSQIATLRRWHCSRAVYVPDVEYNEDWSIKTEATQRTIKALLPLMVGGADGLRSLKVATLSNPKGLDKVDACTSLHEYGAPVLLNDLGKAVDWYIWQLSQAATLACVEDIAAAAFDTYASIQDPAARERIKKALQAGTLPFGDKLSDAGVNSTSLSEIDRTGAATSYRAGMAAVSGQLSAAIDKRQSADKIGKIIAQANKVQHSESYRSFAAQMWATREQMTQDVRDKQGYIETGWILYNDNGTSARRVGFSPSNISVIGAPTSHGKTLFCLQTALNLVRNDSRHIIYISLENDREQLLIRALSAYIGGVKGMDWQAPRNLRRAIREYIKADDLPDVFGDYQPQEFDLGGLLDGYFADIAPRLHLIGAGNQCEALCNNITAAVDDLRGHGQDVAAVIIDYLQLVRPATPTNSRTADLKAICDSLNGLAKSTGVALVCASQMNRDSTSTQGVTLDGITTANLGESASIENIAEDCYMIYSTDRVNDRDYMDKAGKWDIKSWQRRGRRVYVAKGGDDLLPQYERRGGCLYVESLKAREYGVGCYALLPVSFATGAISDKSII